MINPTFDGSFDSSNTYDCFVCNKEELYEMIDIEEPSDFQYFENLANYLEFEGEIPYEELNALFKEVDMDTLSELINQYFEDMTNFVPGSETEIYTILENVHLSLMGMARNITSDEIPNFVDETERFRKWYSADSKVYCESMKSGEESCMPLRDALTLCRMENIGEDKYYYDFSEALDYKMDEYIMSFKDMIALSEENDGNETEDPYDGFGIVGEDY